MPTNQQPDLVTEARGFIAIIGNCGLYPDKAQDFIRQLCDEVERQRTALIKLRDSTSDMWACSFAGEVLKGIAIDDALNHAEKYNHD